MRFMGRAARMQRHHKRHKGEAVINLVSMIDMLTILLFFLLVYSTEEVDVMSKDVQLPESIADEATRNAVTVVVSEQEIIINGKSVGMIEDVMASSSVIIPALQAELEAEAKSRPLPPGLSEDELVAAREVTIMADKEIPYHLLKKVMATSTAAEYGQLSLAVLQKASDVAMTRVAARN
jgi:biopolymer transport protein TolR